MIVSLTEYLLFPFFIHWILKKLKLDKKQCGPIVGKNQLY